MTEITWSALRDWRESAPFSSARQGGANDMQVCCGSLAKDALARPSGKIYQSKFWLYPCKVLQGLEQQSLVSSTLAQNKKMNKHD
jgi:hypothetical protein